jgi:hypothetical protein
MRMCHGCGAKCGYRRSCVDCDFMFCAGCTVVAEYVATRRDGQPMARYRCRDCDLKTLRVNTVRALEFRNDHGPSCTCLEHVMVRLGAA